MYGSNGIIGFRLVHGDGSQDIYSLVLGGWPSYGIVERYGCVFDKRGVTNGMEGVWRLNIAGNGTPHLVWQAGDDAATYVAGALASDSSYVEQLDYSANASDDFFGALPPVEYIAYDALLTARVDPYGNAITLGYDSTNRLGTIADYDGLTNYLSYDANGYLHSVTMHYGRTASFVYDSDGNLGTIVDAQGMTNVMTYGLTDDGQNYRPASLTTPYGTTRFDYVDDMPYLLILDTSSSRLCGRKQRQPRDYRHPPEQFQGTLFLLRCREQQPGAGQSWGEPKCDQCGGRLCGQRRAWGCLPAGAQLLSLEPRPDASALGDGLQQHATHQFHGTGFPCRRPGSIIRSRFRQRFGQRGPLPLPDLHPRGFA